MTCAAPPRVHRQSRRRTVPHRRRIIAAWRMAPWRPSTTVTDTTRSARRSRKGPRSSPGSWTSNLRRRSLRAGGHGVRTCTSPSPSPPTCRRSAREEVGCAPTHSA